MQKKYLSTVLLFISLILLSVGLYSFEAITQVPENNQNLQIHFLVKRELSSNSLTPFHLSVINLSTRKPMTQFPVQLNLLSRDNSLITKLTSGKTDINGIWNANIPPLNEGAYHLELLTSSGKQSTVLKKIPIKATRQTLKFKTNKIHYFPGETVHVFGTNTQNKKDLTLTISGSNVIPLSIPLKTIEANQFEGEFKLGEQLNSGHYTLKLFSENQFISFQKIALIEDKPETVDRQPLLKFKVKPISNTLLINQHQKIPISLSDLHDQALDQTWLKCHNQTIMASNGIVWLTLNKKEIARRIECFVGDNQGYLQKVNLYFDLSNHGYHIYGLPLSIHDTKATLYVEHNLKSDVMYYSVGQDKQILTSQSLALNHSPQSIDIPIKNITSGHLWIRSYLLSNPQKIQWAYIPVTQLEKLEQRFIPQAKAYLPGQAIKFTSTAQEDLTLSIEYASPDGKVLQTQTDIITHLIDLNLFTLKAPNQFNKVILAIVFLSALILLMLMPGFLTLLLIREKPIPLGVYPPESLRLLAIKGLKQLLTLITLWLLSCFPGYFLDEYYQNDYLLITWSLLLVFWGVLLIKLRQFSIYFKRFQSQSTLLLNYTYLQSILVLLFTLNHAIIFKLTIFIFQPILLISFTLFYLKAFLPFIHPGLYKKPENFIRYHLFLLIGILSIFCFHGCLFYQKNLIPIHLPELEQVSHIITSPHSQMVKRHPVEKTFYYKQIPSTPLITLPPIYEKGQHLIKISILNDQTIQEQFVFPIQIMPSVISEFKLPHYGMLNDQLLIPITSFNHTEHTQSLKLFVNQHPILNTQLAKNKKLTSQYLFSLDKSGKQTFELTQLSHSNQKQSQSIYVAKAQNTQTHPRLSLKVTYPKQKKISQNEEIPVLVKFSHKGSHSKQNLGIQLGIPSGFEPLIENIMDVPHQDWLKNISIQAGYINIETHPILSNQSIEFHLRLKNRVKGMVQAPANHLFFLNHPDERAIYKNQKLSSL